MKKLFNDLKNLVAQAATAVKSAARNLWSNAVALLRRLRQATVETAITAQATVAHWWQATRTPLTIFVVTYVLIALFAVSSMMYGFYVERAIPDVQNWLNALFTGQLRLPGWKLTATRIINAPQAAAVSPVGVPAAG